MVMKKRKRDGGKITFLVIREANRKVIRFRLSAVLLYLIPLVGLSVACLALYLHAENLKIRLEKEQLATELRLRTAAYKQAIDLKNVTIEHLQEEILDLAARSDEVRSKVRQLEQLERQIRKVADGELSGEELERLATGAASGGGQRTVSISSYVEDRDDGGMGGLLYPADPDDPEAMAAVAKSDFTELDRRITRLLDDLSIAREDLIAYLHKQRVTPSFWPTESSRVTSSFGYRKDPFTRRTAFHAGIDIAGRSGDPVYAAADGVVTEAGYDRGLGYYVTIRHEGGLKTNYFHLRKYLVKKGQRVEQGEQIGLLGSTGRSTGPHLHFEVVENGKNVDPMTYLDKGKKE